MNTKLITTLTALSVAAVAVLGLTGCSEAQDAPKPVKTSTAAPAPETTDTPETEPSAPSAPDTTYKEFPVDANGNADYYANGTQVHCDADSGGNKPVSVAVGSDGSITCSWEITNDADSDTLDGVIDSSVNG